MTRPSHSGSVASFFDSQARVWSKFYRAGAEMERRKDRFIEALRRRLPAPARVLDLGCGSGEITHACALAGYSMTGCDISPKMLRAAELRYASAQCSFVRAEANRAPALPFRDGSFDGVLASSVLEYVPDVPAQLREINRLLRPGGWLLATVPDMRHPERAAESADAHPWWDIRAGMRARRREQYLRHSVQRVPPARWLEWLRAGDFQPQAAGDCDSPLLLLEASRVPAGA